MHVNNRGSGRSNTANGRPYNIVLLWCTFSVSSDLIMNSATIIIIWYCAQSSGLRSCSCLAGRVYGVKSGRIYKLRSRTQRDLFRKKAFSELKPKTGISVISHACTNKKIHIRNGRRGINVLYWPYLKLILTRLSYYSLYTS